MAYPPLFDGYATNSKLLYFSSPRIVSSYGRNLSNITYFSSVISFNSSFNSSSAITLPFIYSISSLNIAFATSQAARNCSDSSSPES